MGLVQGKDAACTHKGTFFELASEDIKGQTVDFKTLEGRVSLVTNVASK